MGLMDAVSDCRENDSFSRASGRGLINISVMVENQCYQLQRYVCKRGSFWTKAGCSCAPAPAPAPAFGVEVSVVNKRSIYHLARGVGLLNKKGG